MEKNGISQSKLGKMAGIAQPQISAYLTGKANPGLDIVDAIAEALGLSVASLIGSERPALPVRAPTIEEKRLTAISAILRLDRAALETVLDCLKPFMKGAADKDKARSS